MKTILLASALLLPNLALAKDEKDNMDAVRAVFSALESGNLEVLNNTFHPDGKSIIGSVIRSRGGPHDSFEKAAPFPASLDERDVEIELIFGHGNHVGVQSKICGKHVRELVGFKPTGKRLCARYTNLYTFEDGRIVSNAVGFDPHLRKTLQKSAEALAAPTPKRKEKAKRGN